MTTLLHQPKADIKSSQNGDSAVAASWEPDLTDSIGKLWGLRMDFLDVCTCRVGPTFLT